MSGHPTVPVLPAVLALADVLGASGGEIVTALVVGTEVETRLNVVLGGDQLPPRLAHDGHARRRRAAAACSRLMRLPTDVTTIALALAVTQAGGLKASFGTMAKPLHAGRAAADGLLAARLAARGFSGNPEIVEHAQGLVNATLADGAAPRALDATGRWYTAENPLQVPRRVLRHPRGHQQRARAGRRRPHRRRRRRRHRGGHAVAAQRVRESTGRSPAWRASSACAPRPR
jgi:2-methylcitrate dehydratase PrpD